MKKIIIFLVCILAYAEANEPYYVELFGGANFLKSKKYQFQTGYTISAICGSKLCYGLSLEAEYAFRRNKANKERFYSRNFDIDGYFQSSSILVNGLYELPYGLFLGAGLGIASQKIHVYDVKKTEVGFAWQLLAGIDYPLTCDVDVSLQYKYHQGRLAHFHSHSIGIGLTYGFGS